MLKTSITHMAIVVLGSVLALAGDEAKMNLEQEKFKLLQEVEETHARIAQMRVKAMKHEAMAKRLQAEAARLELEMHTEMTRRKQALEMAGAEINVDQLFAEAEQLREHGHLDEAHDLQAKAEGMARMLHGRRQEQEERDLQRMDREIGQLRAQSEQAEREGRLDESRHLWERADQLEQELRGRIEDRVQRDREMRHGEEDPGEPSEQVEHDEDGLLRGQINDLREQMADIRNTMRDILNRLR